MGFMQNRTWVRFGPVLNMLNFCSPIGECILSRRLFGDSDVVFLGKGDDAFFGPVDSTADFDQWLLF